jgi:serine/threonine protein kinase
MTTLTPPRGLRRGTLLAGRYSIVEPIGSGGMGVVYRAVQIELSRDVAVKLMGNGRHAQPDHVVRFEREARMLAKLSHPTIVTIFDFGHADDGTLFLVLELVRGESLEARLRRGRIPWFEAIDLAVQVAEGLAAAHGAGVLHRDLKPSNIMLSSATATRVKLIDFGLARLATLDEGTPVTASSSALMGTPGYIAPEVAWTGNASPQADHYALGVVLFEMLTGEHPFARVDPRRDRLAHARACLVALSPEIPSALVALSCSLLSPDPAQRPRDPLAALSALVPSLPVSMASFTSPGGRHRHAAAFEPLTSSPLSPTARVSLAPPMAGALSRPMVEVTGDVVSLVTDRRLHEVRVRGFSMDKHPVTHGDWLAFVQAGGARPLPTWRGGRPSRSWWSCPVTGVTYAEASAYADWLGRRLPTEAEWVRATGGPQALSYPWGDRWQTGLCSTSWSEPWPQRRPGPIGLFAPAGDSAFGVSDLLAVWEWVSAPYESRGAVVRGGPWRDRCLPPSLHNRSWENEAASDVGFRCVR